MEEYQDLYKNTKLEARISNQIRMTEMQNYKLSNKEVLKIGNFGFWNCFGFRYSDFAFFGTR